MSCFCVGCCLCNFKSFFLLVQVKFIIYIIVNNFLDIFKKYEISLKS